MVYLQKKFMFQETVSQSRFCNHCKMEKLLTDCNKDKSKPLGIAVLCRDCAKEKTNKWYREHLEAERARNREKNNRDPELRRQRLNSWRSRNPEHARLLIRNYYYRYLREESEAAAHCRQVLPVHNALTGRKYLHRRRASG